MNTQTTQQVSMVPYLKSTTPAPTDLSAVLEMIRNNPHADKIEYARGFSKKDIKYKKVKMDVPSWLPHGTFEGGVSDANIKDFSSMMYFDMDHVGDVEEMKTQLKGYPYVYAAWKSFGGEGLGFLVQVNGVIDKASFKEQWNQIALDMDLPVDHQASSLSRKNVISSDPNLWINKNPTSFRYKKKKKNESQDKYKRTLAAYIKKGLKQYEANVHPDTPINVNFRLKQEEFCGAEYLYFEEGRDYCDIYIAGGKIPAGRRAYSMQSIMAKLIYLNPGHEPKSIFKYALQLDQDYCKPPLEFDAMNELFAYLWELFLDGKLYVSSRTKFLWFNPDTPMEKKQRARICQEVSCIKRRENTKNKVLVGLEILGRDIGTVSRKSLAKASQVSERTIRRRADEFQPLIDKHNIYMTKLIQRGPDPIPFRNFKGSFNLWRKEGELTPDIVLENFPSNFLFAA